MTMKLRSGLSILMAFIAGAVAHGQVAAEQGNKKISLLGHEILQPAWSSNHEYAKTTAGDDGDGISDQASAETIHATPLDWGRRRAKHDHTDTVWIDNAGNDTVALDSISLAGADAEDFFVDLKFLPRDRRILPGKRLGVPVTFNPWTPGEKEGEIRFYLGEGERDYVSAALRGFATAEALQAFDYDFGYMSFSDPEKKYADSSRPMEFRAPTDVWFDSVTITGFTFFSEKKGDVNDFRWKLASGTLPITLKPGDRLAIDAWFKPQALGMRWASLTALTADGPIATSYWTANSGIASAGEAPGEAGAALAVYPNPATGNSISVRYTAPGGPLDVALVDPAGRLLRSFVIERTERGEESIIVDITGIPAGHYFLHLGGETFLKTAPVTIIR